MSITTEKSINAKAVATVHDILLFGRTPGNNQNPVE